MSLCLQRQVNKSAEMKRVSNIDFISSRHCVTAPTAATTIATRTTTAPTKTTTTTTTTGRHAAAANYYCCDDGDDDDDDYYYRDDDSYYSYAFRVPIPAQIIVVAVVVFANPAPVSNPTLVLL